MKKENDFIKLKMEMEVTVFFPFIGGYDLFFMGDEDKVIGCI